MVLFDRKDGLQGHRLMHSLTRRCTHMMIRHHIPASESFVDAVAADTAWSLVGFRSLFIRSDSVHCGRR